MIWTRLKEVKDIGIDFDKTICNTGPWPDYIPGEPIDGVSEALTKLKEKYNIVIFTARPWSDKYNIMAYCDYHMIPFNDVVCGKPLLHFMVDDRNIEFDGDWNKALEKAVNFK